MNDKNEIVKTYTLEELEEILGVTYRTLLNYLATGKLKGVKIGRKWHVSEENLKNFLNGK